MNSRKIDLGRWNRREHYEHYYSQVPCSFSITDAVDITALLRGTKARGVKFYAALVYLLATVVNRREEFRMMIDADGDLAVWDEMVPSYTVFHKESETFSSLFTPYSASFSQFNGAFLADIEQYGELPDFFPQNDMPANLFNISAIPWRSFSGFQLNLPKGEDYLTPIFTMGKYYEREGRTLLPFSAQVHHAVCDGFHVTRLIDDCEEMVRACETWLDR